MKKDGGGGQNRVGNRNLSNVYEMNVGMIVDPGQRKWKCDIQCLAAWDKMAPKILLSGPHTLFQFKISTSFPQPQEMLGPVFEVGRGMGRE